VANTLAYYVTATITAVKSFMVLPLGQYFVLIDEAVNADDVEGCSLGALTFSKMTLRRMTHFIEII